MARFHGIFLLVAFGLVVHSDGLLSNYQRGLLRMLKHELVGDPAEVAWHVVLAKPFELCSGSIINKYWVLTAAHCVSGAKPAHITVVAVASDFDVDFFRTVSYYITYDGYDAYTRRNDVALVRVSEPYEFSGYVKPIQLSTTLLSPGVVGRQIQFCFLEDGSEAGIITNRTAVSTGECEKLYGVEMPAPMVCAAGSQAEAPAAGCESHGPVCLAEAGGALVSAAGHQIALLTWSGSWSDPPRNTDVYVDVAHLRSWIEGVCAK